VKSQVKLIRNDYVLSGLLGFLIYLLSTSFEVSHLFNPIGLGDGVFGYAVYNSIDFFNQTALQFGYPFGIDLRFFPSNDWASVSFISLFSRLNPFLGFNLLYALSFPIVSILSALVLKKIGVRSWVSILLSGAMTAIPFHWWRLEHQSLSLLISVPLGVYVGLVINSGDLERAFLKSSSGNSQRNLVLRFVPFLKILSISFLISQLGLYFAVFSLLITTVAIIRRFAVNLSMKLLIVNAMPGTTIIFGLFVALLPTLLISDQVASIKRQPVESLIYSGQLVDAIFPSSQSLVPGLNLVANNLAEINGWASAVGAIGVRLTSNHGTFFTMLAVLLISLWMFGFFTIKDSLRENFRYLLTTIAIVTLLMIPFGFSEIIATMISPQIRAWDRIIPLFQFLLIASLALIIESILSSSKRVLPSNGMAGLFMAGLILISFDTALPAKDALNSTRELATQKYITAKWDTREISQITGKDCGILQLPYIAFPESAPREMLGVYEPLWLGLAGPHNYWSYGGIRESKQGKWLSRVSTAPGRYKDELINYGFCGIVLDTRGYSDQELQTNLSSLQIDFGTPKIIGANNYYVFTVKN
jgi:phosphoglycerol transferase